MFICSLCKNYGGTPPSLGAAAPDYHHAPYTLLTTIFVAYLWASDIFLASHSEISILISLAVGTHLVSKDYIPHLFFLTLDTYEL